MKRVSALVLAMLLVVSMAACGVQQKEDDRNETKGNLVTNDLVIEESKEETQLPTENETGAVSEDEESKPEETEKSTEPESDKIDKDFKKAMDAYEAFMDEYVAFMKKYQKNPGDLSILTDYAKYMQKYAEFAKDFEKWEDEDMNAAELAYYIDVQARVTKKLLEVAQ